MSTYTIPHAADTISNAITKVESTITSGTLSDTATLVNANVIKNYVDGEVSTVIFKTVNGVTTAGSLLFSKMFESAETTLPTSAPNAVEFNHDLGTTPLLVQVYLKCISSNNGFTTNDIVAPVEYVNSYTMNNTIIRVNNEIDSWFVNDPDVNSGSSYIDIDGTLPIADNWRLLIRAFA